MESWYQLDTSFHPRYHQAQVAHQRLALSQFPGPQHFACSIGRLLSTDISGPATPLFVSPRKRLGFTLRKFVQAFVCLVKVKHNPMNPPTQ